MLAILLMILKIIGIVILVILGVIIALIMVILFVPIKYRIQGEYYDSPMCTARITWLLKIISFKLHFEDNITKITIRILGFRIKDKKDLSEKMAQTVAKKTKEATKSTTEAVADSYKEATEETHQATGEDDLPTREKVHPEVVPITEEKKKVNSTKPAKEIPKKKINFKKSKPKKNEDEKEVGIFQKIRGIIISINEFIHNEENKKSIRLTWTTLKKLMNKIKPRKLKLTLHFGTGDPAYTGYILGGLSVILALLGNHFEITPDFEQAMFEGKVNAQGKIRLIHFLLSGIKLYRDKNIKKLILNH